MHELYIYHLSRATTKPVLGFPTRSATNQTVEPQKMARGLKFQIYEVEGLYYLFSKNKGANQMQGYCAADPGTFSYAKRRLSHDAPHFDN